MPPRYHCWSLAAGVLIWLVVASSGCEARPSASEPTFRELIEQVRRGEATEIVVAGEPVGDGELAILGDLSDLTHLAIENFQGTRVGLETIAQLPNLERLQLRGGDLGDEAMAVIARCANLNNLNLPDARFRDAGLAELKSLSQLELLRFHSVNVTDDGMAQIAAMESLRFLHLIGVPITDQGLAHLESMQQLESLYIDDARVTDEGLERLLKALPGLHLHINQQHSDRDPKKGSHPH